MSDTPETDAYITSQSYSPTEYQWRCFARKLERERDELRKAIKNFYKAKGRHNSQIAAARMFELVGLPAEYPQVKAPK